MNIRDNKDDDLTLVKSKIISWLIFGIPLFITVAGGIWMYFEAYNLFGVEAANSLFLFSVFPIIILPAFFFFGRYFVERAKRKILQTRLNRGQNRIANLESIVAEQKAQLESRGGESTP